MLTLANMKQVNVIYHPSLRTTATPVTVFDESLPKLADEMLEIMHKNIGMGLAANQLGIDKRLLVIEFTPPKDEKELKAIPKTVLCNAKVTKFSREKDTMTEGCLSLPGLELPVERSSGVTVEAQDVTGKPVTIKAKGLFARILQHEIDHLNGILFTDHAKQVEKIKNYFWANSVFFGSDEFSLVVLKQLVEAGWPISAIVTETDKQAGRGLQLKQSETKKWATENGIAVFQPETKAEITEILSQIKPHLALLASYGKIIPDEALNIPTYGFLNVHPSLLPKYRGATPLQSVILNGDEQTGVTIMKMDAGVDTGGIVAQKTLPLHQTETFSELKDALAAEGASLLLRQLPSYLSGQNEPKIQNNAAATGTKKLSKDMGEIDWTQSAEQIDRQVRALNPWPGTYTFLGEKRLKILASQVSDGKLSLLEVQLEGKKPTAWPEFVRGYQKELNNCSWYGKIS